MKKIKFHELDEIAGQWVQCENSAEFPFSAKMMAVLPKNRNDTIYVYQLISMLIIYSALFA
jgi:hypothetical protein